MRGLYQPSRHFFRSTMAQSQKFITEIEAVILSELAPGRFSALGW
jgi:hypothetical protein